MNRSRLKKTDKVSIAGHIAFDTIVNTPCFPKKNHSNYITDMRKYPGGGAGNIAMGLNTLGCKSHLLSVVGEDFRGSNYEKKLQDSNIDLDLTYVSEPTAQALIFLDKAKDQKTYFHWGASRYMEKVKPVKCKILHLAPCSPKFCIKMIPHADYSAFEPGQDIQQYSPESLRFCLENTNIFFCNNYEFQQSQSILGLSSKAVLQLVDTTIVTYGEQGSSLHKDDKIVHIPSVNAPLVDPTGAGDGYRAGFWSAKMHDISDDVACKMGSIVSSFVVQKSGGQSGLPNWDSLVKKYEETFGGL